MDENAWIETLEKDPTKNQHGAEIVSSVGGIDSVFRSFYRNPNPQLYVDVVRYVRSLEEEPTIEVPFYVVRIPQIHEECRTALEALQSEDETIAAYAKGIASSRAAELIPKPLELPLDHPAVMDLLWAEFFVTGNTEAVDRIVSILDREDNFRAKLVQWLQTQLNTPTQERIFEDYQDRFENWGFPIDYDTGTIDEPLDSDFSVARLMKDGKLKVDELPFELTTEDCTQMAMKSAAVWSLRNVAEDDPKVAAICVEAAVAEGRAASTLL